jgi:amyloid beta precursor protein binding protein 1
VDPTLTTGADVGNNFFLHPEDIGQSRAAATCALLAELNPDVRLHDYATLTVEELLSSESTQLFDTFSIVVAVDVPESDLLALAAHCWQTNKPLVAARVCGFFGYLRVVVPEHTGMCLYKMLLSVLLMGVFFSFSG